MPGAPTTAPGRPAVVEPPQPDVPGPAPAPEAETKAAAAGPAPAGPGAAPTMGAELLPGDEARPPMLRLPPPRRPPYSGVGLFIGAGITFSAALSEQIVAHILVKRRCIDAFASQSTPDADTTDEAEEQARDFGDVLLECAPGVLPAVALRVHSDIGLLATIGLAAAGAALRAQRSGYDDVFGDKPAKPMLALRATGVTLIGTGVVTWLTTGALSWGVLAGCRTARCATRARLMAFTTRDAGAVLIAVGSGMLAYAVSHRRAYDRFYRERALSVGLTTMPGGGGGLSMTGRF